MLTKEEIKQEEQIQTAVLNRKIKQAQQKELKELKQEKEFYEKMMKELS